MRRLRTIELTFGAVFICLMAIGANITVWFPILAVPIGGMSVPLSLQTFFATIAGLLLGKRLGMFTMIAYVLVGFVGVPVFSNLSAGPMALVMPTGGFILSFIFVAFIVGWIAEFKYPSKVTVYSIAALIGLIINYAIGVSYMYIAINTWLGLEISYILAWVGMIPFIIKDSILAFSAALFSVNILRRIPGKLI